jgi:L-Ala-D/L-Glu epimerase
MIQLHLHSFDLPLRHTFSISHESRDVMPTLIVELRDDAGHRGFGEATETRYYGVYRREMIDRLEALRPRIEATPLTTPARFIGALLSELGDHYFLRCALDVAAHDLWGKRQGRPLRQLWGLPERRIPTCFTIGMADIPTMVAKMKEQPWPIYKIKLGTDHDLDIIRALREHTTATFRVDANTAWTAAQTVALAPQLRDLGVEFIEQPLPPADREGQAHAFAHSVLPLLADESCHREEDVADCAGLFHGINIKLMKCGGLGPARRMIEQAKARGLSCMVGCMTESSVGIAAIAQLVPLLDYVDMDGALLLREEPATPVRFAPDGRVIFPAGNGTGASLN